MGLWKWINAALLLVTAFYGVRELSAKTWFDYNPTFKTTRLVVQQPCRVWLDRADEKESAVYRLRFADHACRLKLQRASIRTSTGREMIFQGHLHAFQAVIDPDEKPVSLQLNVEHQPREISLQ